MYGHYKRIIPEVALIDLRDVGPSLAPVPLLALEEALVLVGDVAHEGDEAGTVEVTWDLGNCQVKYYANKKSYSVHLKV